MRIHFTFETVFDPVWWHILVMQALRRLRQKTGLLNNLRFFWSLIPKATNSFSITCPQIFFFLLHSGSIAFSNSNRHISTLSCNLLLWSDLIFGLRILHTPLANPHSKSHLLSILTKEVSWNRRSGEGVRLHWDWHPQKPLKCTKTFRGTLEAICRLTGGDRHWICRFCMYHRAVKTTQRNRHQTLSDGPD